MTQLTNQKAILNEIGTVFIPVRNIEAARDWYCNLLQMPADGEVLHGHLYVLPMNGAGIVLDSKIFQEDRIFKTPVFHLNTNDIQAAYQFAQGQQIKLLTDIQFDHYFNIEDPDGNALMICKC